MVREEGLKQREILELSLEGLECAQIPELSVTAHHAVGYREKTTRVQGEWHKMANFSVNHQISSPSALT